MTVKQLIEKLKEFDENLIVAIDDADTNWTLLLKSEGVFELDNKLFLSASYGDEER